MQVIGEAVMVAAVILLAVLGRALFVLVKPYRPCRWCRPGGLLGGSLPARLAGHEPGRRRRRGCWRCKGKRLTRRLGARQVHKTREALAGQWAEWRSP